MSIYISRLLQEFRLGLYCKLRLSFNRLISIVSYTNVSPGIILGDITDLQATSCQQYQSFRTFCVKRLLIFHPSDGRKRKSRSNTWPQCTLTKDSD